MFKRLLRIKNYMRQFIPGLLLVFLVSNAFAARIKGIPIAPNSDDLSTEDIERIRESIEKVAGEMERAGMPPGSDEAMRIF